MMQSLQEQYQKLMAEQRDPKRSAWGNNTAAANGATLASDVLNMIIFEALKSRASDIHIEPFQEWLRIRFRVDGNLYEVLRIPHAHNVTIVPRIKVSANMPTDAMSGRKSMDGRFSITIGSTEFDFRVATFPTLMGDKIAIRILNKDQGLVDLAKIGMSPQDLGNLEKILQRKNGLLIVSGPTGSGKTTTLYSILNRIHTTSVNIVTLEDPIEYQIYGINQCDINKKGDETFASGLKSILRQDPDVILIGEVRDAATADIAIRASITGHLVLTSLHANSAVGTVIRLVNMGLERYMVSYAVIGAVAQRLVPRLCKHCCVPYTIEANVLQAICDQCGLDIQLFSIKSSNSLNKGLDYSDDIETHENISGSMTLYKKVGCEQCNGTGYLGRVGIFEVVFFSDDLRDAIVRNASVPELEAIARRKGFRSLAIDAIEKAKQGLVTVEDIYSILLEKGS
ncbi:MAG: GspE/PulE family protein [Candidatus Omnitrophota bacterium]